MARQQVIARRHHHRAAVRRRIGGDESGGIVRHAIPLGTEITHIDKADQITGENGTDILDRDIVDTHQPACRAGQVQPQMAVIRPGPDQINAGTRRSGDDRADRDNRAIGGQLGGRAGRGHAGQGGAIRAPRPTRDAHSRQRPRHRLDPHGDTQIAAGQNRRLPHVTDAGDWPDFQHFQTAREILIGGDKHPRPADSIGIGPRRAVAAGPDPKARRKWQRVENDGVGDGFVHG